MKGEIIMDTTNSITISLRIPREIYAELYKRKGKGKIKSLQDFIIQAIREKLKENEK